MSNLHVRTLTQYIASHDTIARGVSLSYPEIADILELTVSAARRIVAQAVAQGTLTKAADFAQCGRRSPNRYLVNRPSHSEATAAVKL